MTQPAFERDPAAPDSQGQRRYLTILFSDLSESMRLGELMETEHYSDMLAGLRRLCRSIIPKHGGSIARIQGDGVLSFFGYPDTGEDDGRRAAEAALELHAAVSKLAVYGVDGLAAESLTLHSGIHAGLVWLAVGDVERGRFELLGNVPNVAARLSSVAGRDDILVSEETLGPNAHFFTMSVPVPVLLKGRSTSVLVYRVLARALTRNRFEARVSRGLCPFVGREAQVRVLREQLRKAMSGVPQCVALSGAPGVGKTRLVEELLRHEAAMQCLVLQGYCESYLNAEPLQPFLQILRSISVLPSEPVVDPAGGRPGGTGISTAHGGETWLNARRAVALDASSRGKPVGARMDALGSLFDDLASRQPIIVTLDDWQWADDASRQVLDAILALSQPILVVVGSRDPADDDLVRKPTASISLGPLSEGESSVAMGHLLPGADPFLVAEIHRYAGGIPLFIEELCHSAAARGSQSLIEIPARGAAWLNALIESRVGRLPLPQIELVRAAAVIGGAFPSWLLESVTGHRADSALVRMLAEQDFIFPSEQPGELRFKHGITRDVVYETVGLHARRAMHRRIAEILSARVSDSGEDFCEPLAYHCAAGGLLEEAAHYSELAGDKAMASSALDRARAQYAAALQALDRTESMSRELQLRWCGISQKLGMAVVFDPLGLADGVATFERGVFLARASGDLPTIARAEYWLGYICYAKGMARAALVHSQAALELSRQIKDDRLAAQVSATYGQTLLSACQYGKALVMLDAALDSKRRHAKPGGHTAVGSAYALACKGYLMGDQGQFAQAHECFGEALVLIGDSPHQVGASVRHWMSVVYQWQGRWEEALRTAEEASKIAEVVKSRQQLAMGRALAAFSRWIITRAPDAAEALKEVTTWIESRKGGLATSLNHGWLVDISVSLGRLDDSRGYAARLFSRIRQHDRIGEAIGCRALARAAAKLNDYVRAERYVNRAMYSAQVRSSAHELASTQLCAAQIEADRGRADEARRLLDLAVAGFESLEMLWHLERAQRVSDSL